MQHHAILGHPNNKHYRLGVWTPSGFTARSEQCSDKYPLCFGQIRFGECLHCGIILISASLLISFRWWNCQTELWAAAQTKFGETICYSESHVFSQGSVVGIYSWWSLGHMKQISPLMIFCWFCLHPKPQLQWRKEVRARYNNN